MQSPVIALRHIQNSAWANVTLYSKTCKKKGFLGVIYITIAFTQAQFLPRVRTKFKAKKELWYMVSPNETTLRDR